MNKEKALRIQRIYNWTRFIVVLACVILIMLASVWI